MFSVSGILRQYSPEGAALPDIRINFSIFCYYHFIRENNIRNSDVLYKNGQCTILVKRNHFINFISLIQISNGDARPAHCAAIGH